MTHNWEKYFDTSTEYWEKIQKIYKENDNYPKIVVKNRNLHHKFLRAFSKLEGTEIDNDNDNLVSLSEGEHFLVHYYLWKCCIAVNYRRIVSNAFKWMARKSLKYVTDEAVEELAKSWTMKTYNASFSMNGRHHSEDSKQKMRYKKLGKKQHWKHDNAKNRHWYNNGVKQVMAYECPEGFTPGRLLVNKENKDE